jgi:hypothetical protein
LHDKEQCHKKGFIDNDVGKHRLLYLPEPEFNDIVRSEMRESTLVSFEPSQISIQSPMILGQFKGPFLLKLQKNCFSD